MRIKTGVYVALYYQLKYIVKKVYRLVLRLLVCPFKGHILQSSDYGRYYIYCQRCFKDCFELVYNTKFQTIKRLDRH